MMKNRTFFFKNQPRVVATATIGGPKEGAGPVGKCIDTVVQDDYYGEKTFEKAERKMLTHAITHAIKKAHMNEDDIGAVVAGDLLNQIISSSYACREFNIPFLGVYNACSTMSEAFVIGGMMVDGGYCENVLCATGSHFSSAERQYRYPLELGSTRPPQAQWTVTGAGAAVLSSKGRGPKLVGATLGKVVDFGITDANNMAAAGAIAAPMLLTSVTPKSTTFPSVAPVTAMPSPSLASKAAPAPVTVHCACGGRMQPSSRG